MSGDSDSKGRRLPEDAVRAGHYQHLLARRFDRPQRPAVNWELRVKARDVLADVPKEVLAAFLRARAAAEDVSVAAVLEDLARAEPEIAVPLLDTMAGGPIGKDLADNVRGLVRTGSLIKLEPRAFKRVLREIECSRHAAGDLAVLISLAECPGLFALENKERIELLNYLLGPSAGEQRRSFLQSAWQTKRAALKKLVESSELKRRNVTAQGEMLRDFLYYPCEDVYLMEANVFGGRKMVCFGSPSERTLLSYGQISRYSMNGPFSTRIESPDACIASGFTASIRDTMVMYRYRRLQLSREEVRRTIEWIEADHEIGSEEGQGEIARVLAAHKFFFNCHRFVSTFTAGREIEEGTLYEGRKTTVDGSQTDQFSERLLNEYLAA